MGADDQVVEHLDPEQAAGFAQVAGHRQVLGAWSRVPRRVAVRQHDRRGIVPQGRLEDVARLQGGDVEAAERDRLTAERLVAGVQEEDAEPLLPVPPEVLELK